MNIQGVIAELGLKKVTKGNEWYYEGVVIAGAFNCINNNGYGLLTITIKPFKDIDSPIIIINTSDDDYWAAFANFDKGKIDIDILAKEFTEEYNILMPSEFEFNCFLGNHLMFGCRQ